MATHIGTSTTIEVEPAARPLAERLRPGPALSALVVPAALLLTVVVVAALAILAPGDADAATTGTRVLAVTAPR